MAANDFSAYKRQLRADIETDRRAKLYFSSLYTAERIRVDQSVFLVGTREAYELGLQQGRTHEEMLRSAKTAYRASALAHADASRKSIIRRLDRVQAKYFREVRRHKKRPMVSYDAETDSGLRTMRSKITSKLTLPSRADPNLASISDGDWIRSLREFEKGLEELKLIARRLSEKLTSWEKAIDDKRRLTIAYRAFILTIMLFIVNELKEFFTRNSPPQPSFVVEVVIE